MSEITTTSGREPAVAVVGAGGYAGEILRLLGGNADVLRLAAVCEPDAAKRAAARAEFGVAAYDDLGAMLAALPAEVRGVWLPVPIHLHVPFARRVLESGRAVMVEKPPAGTVQEVDELAAMAEEHRGAVGVAEPVLVGYQHLYDPSVRRLKRLLLDGAIGEVRSATVTACWPRDDAYYGRNDWAGALRRGGRWVLDSPANNALAHMVNLALFLLGDAPDLPADVARVEAELCRARPIENFDTCGIRATTRGGRTALVLLTHACREMSGPTIDIAGDGGAVRWDKGGTIEIDGRGGRRDLTFDFGGRRAMLAAWRAVLEGREIGDDLGHLATPAAVRAQTVLVNAAAQATAARDVAGEFVEVAGGFRAVRGIEADFQRCRREGRLPNELALPWASPGGSIDVPPDYQFSPP